MDFKVTSLPKQTSSAQTRNQLALADHELIQLLHSADSHK